MKKIKFIMRMLPRPKQRARLAVKNRYGNYLRKPHSYTPEGTANAENDVRMLAYNFRPKGSIPAGPVMLEVISYLPWPKNTPHHQGIAGAPCDSDPRVGPWPILKNQHHPDSDNLGKLICDAFNGLFYIDDIQIIKELFEKRYSTEPRIEISITYLNHKKTEEKHGKNTAG